MIKNLAVWLSVISLCSASALADGLIEQRAPEDSVVIVSVDNVAASLDRLRQSKLWELWEAPQIKQLRLDVLKQFTEELNETLEQLGVEKDTLAVPQGSVGLAIYPLTPEDFEGPSSGMLLVADYGENADKTGQLIEAAIAQADENPDIQYEVQEIAGHTVYTFDLSEIQLATEDAADEPDFASPMPLPMGAVSEMLALPTKFHFVRDGTVFMLCSDLDRLTNVLQREPGDGEATIADREDYQAVMDQLGESDASVVVLLRDIGQLAAANDPMGMAEMMQEMLKTIIGDVHGLGVSLKLDSDSAIIEETVAVYMPNGKAGLTALLDTQTPRGDVPPFVGPDTVNYTRMNFEFENLPDFVMQILQMMAMMMPMEPEQMHEIVDTIAQLCDTLSSEVYLVSTLSRPITAESLGTVFAVQCARPQEFENFVAEFAPQGGFEPREFLGQRIYSGDMPMMPGMPMGGAATQLSIGISGGYALIGPTAGVEQAMRAAGDAKLPSLDREASYQRAVDTLSDEPIVGFGYSSTIDLIEATRETMRLAAEQMIEQIKEFDPEFAAEYEQQQMAKLKQWEAIDLELLGQFIGPSSWSVHATHDGFVIRAYLLAPVGDE